MRLKKLNLKQVSFFLIIVLPFITSGCTSWGDVPEIYQIDKGGEPDNQDKMVRFRTTYYFRVVDSCKIEDGNDTLGKAYKEGSVFKIRTKGKLKIVNDSLYRFRMTGKANALFNTIHFESGVLREEEIDPIGSTLKFNNETKSYKVIGTDRRSARGNNWRLRRFGIEKKIIFEEMEMGEIYEIDRIFKKYRTK